MTDMKENVIEQRKVRTVQLLLHEHNGEKQNRSRPGGTQERICIEREKII